jgi:hypothetical protein
MEMHRINPVLLEYLQMSPLVYILSGKLDHIHETNAQKLERQILRTACKRKAVDMISERPSKLYIDWRTYFKSFFSKFSSSILKSSELMIFEGRSDIISTAFLLQAVLKICRSSFCAFVSCIWSNLPLGIWYQNDLQRSSTLNSSKWMKKI